MSKVKQKPGPKAIPWTLELIAMNGTPDGECLIWQGGKHRQGYGMVRYEGKMRTIHSVVAELKYGVRTNKQSKQKVTRTCNNLLCCNPDHIIIEDTHTIMKNANYTGKNARFHADTIRAIRKEFAEKDPQFGLQSALAKKYNTRPHHIWQIVRGITYNWVK